MRQFILREESNAKALYAYLKANWRAMAANNTPFVAIVEEYKAKRHNQQNRLYWSYLKQIATQAMVDGKQYSDECWHEHFKGEFLGYVDLPNGRKMAESTTKLNVTDFASYVNKVEAYAVTELGVIFEENQRY